MAKNPDKGQRRQMNAVEVCANYPLSNYYIAKCMLGRSN